MKNKGISMIALIATIVAISVIAGTVIVSSYKYIEESNKVEKNSIKKIVSEAIEKVDRDINIDTTTSYIGYKIVLSDLSNIELIENEPQSAEVSTGEWYLLDIDKLKELGIKNKNELLEKYAVQNIMSVSDTTTKHEMILVNYITYKVYMVKANKLAAQ